MKTFRLENGSAVYMDSTADYQLRSGDALGIRAQIHMRMDDAEDLKFQLAIKEKVQQILINAAEFGDEIDPNDLWNVIGELPEVHLSEDAMLSYEGPKP